MIDDDGVADAKMVDDDLSDLAELVRSAAAATAELWRASGLDGDRTVRLVEVSHALQRASLALADAARLGDGARHDRRSIDPVAAPAAESRRASHDLLTGLVNGDLLVDRITHALARLQRHPGHCALLFVDLDEFEGVNDRHGHGAGDRLLTTLGHRMCAAVRPSDTVARLGGDEFVVLCEDLTSEAEADDIGARLLATILAAAEPAGPFGRVTASIGVAVVTNSAENAHEFLDRADLAMREAKARGGDTIYCAPARTRPAQR